MKLRVGIFGGSGYGGAELLRILLFHPHAEVELVTANEHAGKAVGEVHRNLNGLTGLSFAKAPEDFESLRGLDCVFLALPHGQALEVAPRLPPDVKVVDLSGDFRLDSAEEFAAHYGREHTARELQREFVYGLTEVNREKITRARLVSNPGCFATATLLGLAPLVAANEVVCPITHRAQRLLDFGDVLVREGFVSVEGVRPLRVVRVRGGLRAGTR